LTSTATYKYVILVIVASVVYNNDYKLYINLLEHLNYQIMI